MGRWSRVEALLDKEVQRETKRYLAKIKALVSGGGGNGHTKPVEAKPKRRASPRKASPARVLHGRYLGLIRNLTVPQRKMVKEIREGRGVRLAIAAAKKMRKSAEV